MDMSDRQDATHPSAPVGSQAANMTRARACSDTSTVDAGDSFELWHQVTCRNYSNSELKRPSDSAFSARISMRPFGALGLSDVSSCMGAAQLIRGPEDIRKDQRDHFMLFLVTEGEIGVAQDGREARAQAGDMFLYDQTRPLTLTFQQRYRSWMLSIPRPMLEARLLRARAVTANRIAGDTALGALVGTTLRQLDGFGADTRAEIADRIAASTVDIVATALDGETGGGTADYSGQHRLLANAEGFLRANLHDTELTIETIARALNTSPRTLNRAFAGEGTTPMRWLWRQRLEACNRALADGRVASVTEAAFSFGFNDVSHFSRAFKKAFGKSPRVIRRR